MCRRDERKDPDATPRGVLLELCRTRGPHTTRAPYRSARAVRRSSVVAKGPGRNESSLDTRRSRTIGATRSLAPSPRRKKSGSLPTCASISVNASAATRMASPRGTSVEVADSFDAESLATASGPPSSPSTIVPVRMSARDFPPSQRFAAATTSGADGDAPASTSVTTRATSAASAASSDASSASAATPKLSHASASYLREGERARGGAERGSESESGSGATERGREVSEREREGSESEFSEDGEAHRSGASSSSRARGGCARQSRAQRPPRAVAPRHGGPPRATLDGAPRLPSADAARDAPPTRLRNDRQQQRVSGTRASGIR